MINSLFRSIYSLLYRVVSLRRPIRKNTVIFVCTRGDSLHDNLASIRAHLDPDVYSVEEFFFNQKGYFDLIMNRFRFIIAMAQTEYTLLDDYFSMIYGITLRPGARLVQVWHALGAMKRMGFSRLGKAGGPTSASDNHRNYTDVIVSSDEVRPLYAEAFGVDLDAVHATGVPRSDFFFNQDEQAEAMATLYHQIPLLVDKRVILYAPTFRGNGKQTAYFPSDIVDLEALGQALGEHDLLVLKMHPFVAEPPQIPSQYADKIIDLSDYPEFNHLLLASDLLITDYSSAIFEYALLKLPILFYTPDLDDYREARGFYFPFEDYTYGPVITDFHTLLACLDTTGVNMARVKVFHERFLNRCDGKATQRLIDTVFQSHLTAQEVGHRW